MPAPKSIARFGLNKRGKPRVHAEGCSRHSCDCREEPKPPHPLVCACRTDDDGHRWFNLGCRVHVRLWSPEWATDRPSNGTALTGTHLYSRRPSGRPE